MKEIFNNIRIQKIADRLNVECDSLIELIKNRKIFPFVKDNYILFTEDIFKVSSDEDKEMIYSTFFPLKRESLRSGGTWYTRIFKYNVLDEKIHWIVGIGEGDRHFKLKTSNFEDRIPEIVNKWEEKLKKEIDSLYGYWLTDEKYITDKSLTKNGYRLLCDMYHYNKNSFSTKEEWETMKNDILS